MYKLLIVDDEPLVCVALQSMLPWSSYHIEICGTAINGRQALEMIGTLQPDLVITDIKMPVMTGLELLETCYSVMDPTPEFIILTCYEDFPFIKTVLKYQAVDYIIKLGIKPEELEHSVRRALKNIENKNPRGRETGAAAQYLRDKFFLKLFHNLFESEEQFGLQAEKLGLSLEAAGYVLAACAVASPGVSAADRQYEILCRSALSMLSNLLTKYVTVWLVSPEQQHFHVLFQLEEESPYLEQRGLSSLLHEVMEMIENYFNVTIFCGVGDYKHDIHHVPESYQESRQVLSLCTKERPVVFYQEYRPRNTLVTDIVRYIKTHLDEKLVLNDVAVMFSISPNYMGHLFKKTMSMGFNEYVTQAKISRAKYLMSHTDLKMYEIAEKVGFENSFYFSRVFKKTEGISPRRYLQEHFPERSG